jgi:hypothetical protein
MSAPDAVLSNACPICGENRIHHERLYVVQGQRMVMRFAACLHDVDERTKGGASDAPLTPPLVRAPRS